MTERPAEIEQMLQARRLEPVGANPDHARSVIVTAQRHLQTAELLAQTEDVAMALLTHHGLRARPVGGGT